jgi:xylan 1,4-beta-xylosidase
LQKAGHGELVQAATGQWFLAHLAARPVTTPHGARNPLGRETAIQPVVWKDGWPRLAQGGWHPAVEAEVPTPTARTVPATASGGLETAPGWPWSTLREPPGDWVDASARPGWVRLRGRMDAESLWQQSLLAQRITEHRAEISVTLDADPKSFTQSAGLVLWYNTSSYYQLHLTWAEPDGEPQAGQQWDPRARGRRVVQLVHGRPEGGRVLAILDAPPGPLRLRAVVDEQTARLWSGSVRHDLVRVGPDLDFSELSDDFGPGLRFTGALAGISAVDLVGAAFSADFTDWKMHCTPLPKW